MNVRLGIVVLTLLLSGLPRVEARPDSPPDSTASRPKTIHVVTDDNYPPYLFRNSAGLIEGYLVDYW